MIPHIKYQLQNKVNSGKSSKANLGPIVLVLVPTRELTIQVHSSLRCINKQFHIKSGVLFGGKDLDDQIITLTANNECAHILIATPGRLLDAVTKKMLTLKYVTYFVIDEADRMLMMGFIEQIQAISSYIRPNRQTLFFSATFPGKLRELVKEWMGEDHVVIRCNALDLTKSKVEANQTNKEEALLVDKEQIIESFQACEGDTGTKRETTLSSSLTVSETIEQKVHVCASHKKPRLLLKYLTSVRQQEKELKVRQPGPMLIFCTKIKTVTFIQNLLTKHQFHHGFDILHGKLPQNQRNRALENFKAVSYVRFFSFTRVTNVSLYSRERFIRYVLLMLQQEVYMSSD
jgi:superfamily II DNA/RNA helicase